MFRVIRHRENYRQSVRVLFITLNSDVSILFRHKSHYSSLGLESNASPRDIKAAYYKLSLKYHPDKNQGSAESVEKFREISEAYEILSNQAKKKDYDEGLDKSPYGGAEWREEHYYPRSYHYERRWTKPRTGRTKYYDYDEHYKQHYEEYERMRQADYEQLKRRWEYDFRRRNPYAPRPDWTEYGRREQNDFKENYKFDWKALYPKKYSIFFISLWVTAFLCVAPFLDEGAIKVEPKKEHKPIYYKINKDEDSDDDSSDKT